ncbi:dTDP-4-dehydrorhamnose reductase [Ketogulonicigenium vulgare Y25]|uniref:dTDP-4-dehydrorhamnose reductase n=1 Tax=Ketogulonicigenium vulgare (strain WSH-001) TaxID=759362 RepID=F9Y752_KETVW|nr:dTDP-4-dehydrorhamnose reductase [Ketogulonicigenium vulgare]ADO41246.1 dTDP-4-dehydrorhamnose reductase [Ketogulonicigenium vulgare Y25]AEM42242.1 dTDP-4-dehydrorhamnose reductase [Ketogulonicigenium vulgare WSH-001]ALJ79862.1 dTDP-4-dehydrorhamnose reductase [Ketogulonicigenium vulgare]AOZ53075.1 dTDP-4-dehydrorhamnose reductase [Ketogulonicigenium vulgare]
MKILVFGRTGQVATELQSLVPEVVFLDRTQADLLDPASCVTAINRHRPDAIINAAAWTAVDKAETEEGSAALINGDAPAAMARAAAALDVPFIHISTDYVFNGGGNTPFKPDDPTAPLGAYGRTKRLGEVGVEAAGGRYAILRTSWVFSAHGANFVKTMLRLGAQRDRLNVVADQIGGPTSARAIAQACLRMAEHLAAAPNLSGIYHFSGTPDVSWADFARAIMAAAQLPCTIHDIPSTDYPTPAARPLNSRLDCSSLARFDLTRPDWQQDLLVVLNELGAVK